MGKENPGPGTVITIGADGQRVDPDSLAVELAREIANETGTTVVVSVLGGSEEDGRPVNVNPSPSPSKN